MASGDTLLVLTARAYEPWPNGAAADVRGGHHPVLDFDATVAEYVAWHAVMPRHYAGGGITVTVMWTATTATTGNVYWDILTERLAEGAADIDTIVWGGQATVIAPPASVSGQLKYSVCTIPHASLLVLAGDLFLTAFGRLADHASDTMVGDAELLALEIRET